MKIRFACVGFAVFLMAAGCAPMPTVALQATPGDLEILAGEWAGEYESAALGRRGSIEFRLKAGTDEAHGDVLMVPGGHEPRLTRGPTMAPKGDRVCVRPSSSRSDLSARRTDL